MKRVLPAMLVFICVHHVCAASLGFARSGMLDSPTASILHHTQIGLGGSATLFTWAPSTSMGGEAVFAGHLDIGLFNLAQIGVTYLGSAGISGNAKILVLRERLNTPGLAIGCQNITGERDYEFYSETGQSLYDYPEPQNFSAYFVMTKHLDDLADAPFTVSLGYGIGRFMQGKHAEADASGNPFRGLFSSIEYHPTYELAFMGEWDGRDINAGVSYRLNSNIRLMGAVLELEQLGRGDDRNPFDPMQYVKWSIGAEITLGPLFNRTTLEPFERLSEDRNQDLLRQLEEVRSRAKEDIEELESQIP